jgi:cytochrome P450
MRAIGPMVPTRLGNWATTSYAICNQVLRSRQFGVREETGASPVRSPQEEFDLSFLSLNEPDHARLRRVAAPAFSPKMMAGMRRRSTRRSVTCSTRPRPRAPSTSWPISPHRCRSRSSPG